MTIDSYPALQEALADYLRRRDLTARLPTFIQLAEAALNRRLRTRQMEAADTGLATVPGTGRVALPSDFLELRLLALADNPGRPLAPLSPPDLILRQQQGASGTPRHFAILGGDLHLAPLPARPFGLRLDYYRAIPPLTDAAPSNWLLAAHPDAYLFGALLQAATYLHSDRRVGDWQALYDRAIAAIDLADRNARWSGAPLAVTAEGAG